MYSPLSAFDALMANLFSQNVTQFHLPRDATCRVSTESTSLIGAGNTQPHGEFRHHLLKRPTTNESGCACFVVRVAGLVPGGKHGEQR